MRKWSEKETLYIYTTTELMGNKMLFLCLIAPCMCNIQCLRKIISAVG